MLLIHLANVADNICHAELFEFYSKQLCQCKEFGTLNQQTFFPLLSVLNTMPAGKSPELIDAAHKSLQQLSQDVSFNTSDKLIHSLHFLCVHDLANTSPLLGPLVKKLNTIEYGLVFEELNPELLPLLHDISYYFKLFSTADATLSPHLTHILQANPRISEKQYFKEHDFVDPLRDLLLMTLKKLLPTSGTFGSAQLDYMPDYLKGDLYFGGNTKGQKLLLFLKGQEAGGFSGSITALLDYRTKIIQKYDAKVQPHVLNYLQAFKINFQEADVELLDDSPLFTGLISELSQRSTNFQSLKSFITSALKHIEGLENRIVVDKKITTWQKMDLQHGIQFADGFIREIHRFYELDRKSAAAAEDASRTLLNDKIKYQLAVLSSLWNTMPSTLKSQLDSLFKSQVSGAQDFSDLLLKLKDDYPSQATTQQQAPWMGVRFGLELPGKLVASQSTEKDLAPEVLNHQFMMDSNYHHYNTWRAKFDENMNSHNLNLNVEGADHSQNFHDEKRSVSGVTPRGDRPRNAIRPVSFPWNWEYYCFEFPKDSMKQLMRKELIDLRVQPEYDTQLKFMANLQNLKFAMRSELSSGEIGGLLPKLQLVQSLIASHLGQSSGKRTEGEEVTRNPNDYVEFLEHQSRVWIFKDRYANFILEEAGRREEIKQMYQELQENDQLLFQVPSLLLPLGSLLTLGIQKRQRDCRAVQTVEVHHK